MGSGYFRAVPVGQRTITNWIEVEPIATITTQGTKLLMETCHLPPQIAAQRGNRKWQAIH